MTFAETLTPQERDKLLAEIMAKITPKKKPPRSGLRKTVYDIMAEKNARENVSAFMQKMSLPYEATSIAPAQTRFPLTIWRRKNDN